MSSESKHFLNCSNTKGVKEYAPPALESKCVSCTVPLLL